MPCQICAWHQLVPLFALIQNDSLHIICYWFDGKITTFYSFHHINCIKNALFYAIQSTNCIKSGFFMPHHPNLILIFQFVHNALLGFHAEMHGRTPWAVWRNRSSGTCWFILWWCVPLALSRKGLRTYLHGLCEAHKEIDKSAQSAQSSRRDMFYYQQVPAERLKGLNGFFKS